MLGAALVMGLTGGPHCLAMCAAPCHVVIHGPAAEKNSPTGVTTPSEQALVWQPRNPGGLWLRSLLFHSGRLAGYALIGALAAWAMESLAWMTQQFWSLRPLWTLSHVAMLAWGILMMAQARQPAWVEAAAKRLGCVFDLFCWPLEEVSQLVWRGRSCPVGSCTLPCWWRP